MEFIAGETVVINSRTYDAEEHKLTAPETIVISIWGPAGLAVDGEAMQPQDEGEYVYYFDAAATGDYTYIITAAKAGRTSKTRGSFVVA